MAARSTFAIAAILAFVPAPACPAVPALAGRVLLSGCRQGECGWLRVVRVETVRANGHGELRRLVGRRGTSRYGDGDPPRAYGVRVRIDWERSDRSDYAFCSRERPAYAFPNDGGYILHYLDPFDLAGYQQASATMYMRICHDRGFNPGDVVPLRRLGYRPGTRSEQVEDARPESLAEF